MVFGKIRLLQGTLLLAVGISKMNHSYSKFELVKVDVDKHMNGVISLLDSSGLPTQDIPNTISNFWVATKPIAFQQQTEIDGSNNIDVNPSQVVGAVALERHGTSLGLLRSLVVSGSCRGQGLGRLLCEHIMNEAKRLGIKNVFLLTNSATEYFERHHGFHIVDRDNVPEEIQRTSQYSKLCPCTAIVMAKSV